jgi:hypothetical protein
MREVFDADLTWYFDISDTLSSVAPRRLPPLIQSQVKFDGGRVGFNDDPWSRSYILGKNGLAARATNLSPHARFIYPNLNPGACHSECHRSPIVVSLLLLSTKVREMTWTWTLTFSKEWLLLQHYKHGAVIQLAEFNRRLTAAPNRFFSYTTTSHLSSVTSPDLILLDKARLGQVLVSVQKCIASAY